MVGSIIQNSGYPDEVVISLACCLNEIASRAVGKQYPMAEDDLLNAVDLLDGMRAMNLRIIGVMVNETEEPQPTV
jgi:hypothetical protein